MSPQASTFHGHGGCAYTGLTFIHPAHEGRVPDATRALQRPRRVLPLWEACKQVKRWRPSRKGGPLKRSLADVGLEPFAPRGGGRRLFVFHKCLHHQTGQCVCVPRAGGRSEGGRDAHAPSRGAQPRLGTVQGPPRGGHLRPQDLDRVHSPGDAQTRFAVTEPLAFTLCSRSPSRSQSVIAEYTLDSVTYCWLTDDSTQLPVVRDVGVALYIMKNERKGARSARLL